MYLSRIIFSNSSWITQLGLGIKQNGDKYETEFHNTNL